MCIVELLQSTHVAPVGMIGRCRSRNLVGIEVVDAGLIASREVRGDVAAHIMLGVFGLFVECQSLEQGVRVGNVITHGSEDGVRIIRQASRGLRLLLEAFDHARVFRINLDHAKLVGLADRLANTRNRELRTGFDVLLHHLLEVHTVDVVGADDHHNIWLHIFDDVDGLIDGVGRAEIPVLAETLLGRNRGDIVAEQRRETPHCGNMPVERMGFVLGEHHSLHVAGIDQIAQREVNQSEHTAEWNGRFCSVPGQRHQTSAFTTCKNDGKNFRILRHENSSPRASLRHRTHWSVCIIANRLRTQ